MNAWLNRCVFNLELNRESVCLNPECYQEGYSRVWEPNMKKFYLYSVYYMYTCYLTLLYSILKGSESAASGKFMNTYYNLAS